MSCGSVRAANRVRSVRIAERARYRRRNVRRITGRMSDRMARNKMTGIVRGMRLTANRMRLTADGMRLIAGWLNRIRRTWFEIQIGSRIRGMRIRRGRNMRGNGHRTQMILKSDISRDRSRRVRLTRIIVEIAPHRIAVMRYSSMRGVETHTWLAERSWSCKNRVMYRLSYVCCTTTVTVIFQYSS